MKRFAILFVAVLMLCAITSAAFATDWAAIYMKADGTSSKIKVEASANLVGNLWHYSYVLTPIDGATWVRGYTITFTPSIIDAGVSNIKAIDNATSLVAPGWTGNTNEYQVLWTCDSTAPLGQRLNAGDSFTFSFDHPWAPASFFKASCQDDYGYGAKVPGPAVPEASTMLLGFAGLSCIAGLRRFRMK